MEMQEGQVMTCLAETCSYNCKDECCAPGITVGDDHPACDMFTTKPVQRSDHEPCVDACMVSDCHFNTGSACHAAGVTLSIHAEHADCATYRM